MPRLSEKTRADRRQHILTSAWKCCSRNSFHATSIAEVIAETGMSSSAAYRYFRHISYRIRSRKRHVARVGAFADHAGG